MAASLQAPMLPEGLVKTVVSGGIPSAPFIERGDVVTVKYTCYSTTGDGGDSDNILLARSDSQKMVRTSNVIQNRTTTKITPSTIDRIDR
jgi:hypothetical protein